MQNFRVVCQLKNRYPRIAANSVKYDIDTHTYTNAVRALHSRIHIENAVSYVAINRYYICIFVDVFFPPLPSAEDPIFNF